MKCMRVLYVSHYGILEPLGQSQILPYLTGIAKLGHSLEIISFEKPQLLDDAGMVRRQKEALNAFGIRWFPRRYRRGNSLRHLASDLLTTSSEVHRRCRHGKIELLHCRAHIPSLMAWWASARAGIPMLFDFRGFLAEEYTDAGLWKAGGLRFRAVKAVERALIRHCSAMVVLTESIRDHLIRHNHMPQEKIFVIPCSVDLTKFHPTCAPARSTEGSVRTVYVGSIGGRYCLESMLEFFRLIVGRRPLSELTLLCNNDLDLAESAIKASRLPRHLIHIQSVPYASVPAILASHDLGLAFIRGDLALLAASPTKIGEYLASGLAVVGEEKVGDLQQILVDRGVGCLVDSENPSTWTHAVERSLSLCDRPQRRTESFEVACKYYDLDRAVADYAKAYEFCVSR